MHFSLACAAAATVLLSSILPTWAIDDQDYSDVVRILPKGGKKKSKPKQNRVIITMVDKLDEDATENAAKKKCGGKPMMRLKNKHQKKSRLVMEFTDAAKVECVENLFKGEVKIEPDRVRYAYAGLRHGNKRTLADNIRNLQGQTVPWGIDDVFDDENRSVPGTPNGPSLPNNVQHPICIIDSGYEMAHPDLPDTATNADPDQSIGNSVYFAEDGCGHGSHVAGTIVAMNNGEGVIGVYPGADNIKVVKVFGESCEWTYSSYLVDAYDHCVDSGAKIVSMSLGGDYFNNAESTAYSYGTLYDDMLIIAAAGNGYPLDSKSYPASYDDVMSVAAIDVNHSRASFSKYNDQVDISAPGVDVESTVPKEGYYKFDGTSMATPHVSGVALLLWNNFPSCTNSEIRTALEQSAKDLGDNGRDDKFGHGAVRYWAAFDYLTSNTCGATTNPTTTPPPSTSGESSTSDPSRTSTPPPGLYKLFRLDILTDDYGEETWWEVTDPQGGFVAQGDGYGDNSNYLFEDYIPNNVCDFTIHDRYKDGMCCDYGQGKFEVRVDGKLVAEGGNFKKSETVDLCSLATSGNNNNDPSVGGLKPKNAPCKTSSECLSNNCHKNGKCK